MEFEHILELCVFIVYLHTTILLDYHFRSDMLFAILRDLHLLLHR